MKEENFLIYCRARWWCSISNWISTVNHHWVGKSNNGDFHYWYNRKVLIVTNAQGLFQLGTFLLHFAIKISANCFLCPALLVELSSPLFLWISYNVRHSLSQNREIKYHAFKSVHYSSSNLQISSLRYKPLVYELLWISGKTEEKFSTDLQLINAFNSFMYFVVQTLDAKNIFNTYVKTP